MAARDRRSRPENISATCALAWQVLPRRSGNSSCTIHRPPLRILCRSSSLMQRSIIPLCAPGRILLSLYRVIVCQNSGISFFSLFFLFFFSLFLRVCVATYAWQLQGYLFTGVDVDRWERTSLAPFDVFPPDVNFSFASTGNASRSFEQSVVCPLNPRMHFATHVFSHLANISDTFASQIRLTGDSIVKWHTFFYYF